MTEETDFTGNTELTEEVLANATPEQRRAYNKGRKFNEMLKHAYDVPMTNDYTLHLKHEMVMQGTTARIAVVYDFDFERSSEFTLLALCIARDAAQALVDHELTITDKKKKMPKNKLGVIKSTIACCTDLADNLANDIMDIYVEQTKKKEQDETPDEG